MDRPDPHWYPGQKWFGMKPRNEKALWAMQKIYDHAGNESPVFVDIDGDEDWIFV
jgi:hypothetical protein